MVHVSMDNEKVDTIGFVIDKENLKIEGKD